MEVGLVRSTFKETGLYIKMLESEIDKVYMTIGRIANTFPLVE